MARGYSVGVDTMSVQRVRTETGSHIEPPLDQDASEFDQLRWLAAVVSMDTGLTITVYRQPTWGHFSLSIGSSGVAAFDFHDAWTFLSGVDVGGREGRR